MRCNLDHLDNLDNLTQNPQQNRLFPDGFKIAALITLIILHSTAPANREPHAPIAPKASLQPQPVVKVLAVLAALAMMCESIQIPSKFADFTTRPSRPKDKTLAALAVFAATALLSTVFSLVERATPVAARPRPEGLAGNAVVKPNCGLGL